jgi:hypothetical protein
VREPRDFAQRIALKTLNAIFAHRENLRVGRVFELDRNLWRNS